MNEDQTVKAEFMSDTSREDGMCRNIENNCEINEKCECREIMAQRDLEEIDKMKYAQGIIDYAKAEQYKPGMYEAATTTIKYLKRYIENITN